MKPTTGANGFQRNSESASILSAGLATQAASTSVLVYLVENQQPEMSPRSFAVESQGSASPDSLRSERDLLAECLNIYDRRLREEADQASATGHARSEAFVKAVRGRINDLSGTDTEAASASPTNAVARRGVSRAWQVGCVACLLAIAALIANDRFFSTSHAMKSLSGHWREFQHTKTGEDQVDYYRSYDGRRLTVSSPVKDPGQWHTYRREVSLEPAQGFYVLRLVNVPGVRPDHDSSMFVHIDGDRVNEIRGLHPLDGVRIPYIATFRRNAEGPQEADAID